jgi:hypothetical protein
MSTPKPRVRRLDEATPSILVAAFEAYTETGECAVLCDGCRTPIEFKRLSEAAWEHHCSCGKYNGSLRGL